MFNAAPANNLIRATASTVTGLTADTIFNACPHLGTLRKNGGLTATHALLSHSAAIDAGNNSFAEDFDQRGSVTTSGVMDYQRLSGGAADIGAYEVQQSDIIFNTDFEGCPDLSGP